ncbi:MAG: Ig-like domain-containing protein, partial [Thermoanaerobaculia bacterium]|nr:Ig-like domain-containing protein [Thermoanaerobaculia bacterium]
LEEPFVDFPEGLWDSARRRLTLLFHPGRIKRGVGPNLQLGPPLIAGHRYRLVVEPLLEDGRGRALATTFELELRVGSAMRQLVQPSDWELMPPRTPTGPLVVVFPVPMDHAMAHHALSVEQTSGAPIEGQVRVESSGRRWTFEPAQPWSSGETYYLAINPRFEDAAGNTLLSAFDHELPPPDDRRQALDSDPPPRLSFIPVVLD